MRNISLLPAQMKKDLIIAKRISTAALVLLITAVVSLFLYGLSGLMMLSPLIELESIKAQNIYVSSQISELKPLVELYNQVSDNVSEYKTVTKGLLPANMVVHGLCSNAPEDILLSRVNVGFTAGEQKAIIEGISYSQRSLTIWMNELKENKFVESVLCRTLEEILDSSGASTFRFTLEIPLKDGDQA